jgi:hypothetical protein
MDHMDVNNDLDIIKKPRTNFSNSVLRRAIPKMNVQDKISTLSMNKMNLLSCLRLEQPSGSNNNLDNPKNILSVNVLPKVQSLDCNGIDKHMVPDGKKVIKKKSSMLKDD